MKRNLLLTLLLAALALAGCGGGGGGGGAAGGGGAGGGGGVAPSPTAFSVTVGWPERSRATEAPSSAQSAVIRLLGAAVGGGNVEYTVNRSANLAAHEQAYNSGEEANPGDWTLEVEFYAGPGGGAPLVGVASVAVTLQENGDLTLQNGQPLGTINYVGVITSVQVASGQSVFVGETIDMTFTAFDINSNVVAVSPGSAIFAIASGGDKLSITKDGKATGLAGGLAEVNATVDGIKSSDKTVVVNPQSIGFSLTLGWGERSRAIDGTSSALSARVFMAGAGPSGGDVDFKVNRNAGLDAYEESYNSPTQAKPGTWTLIVEFYSDADGGGDIVAVAQIDVMVLYDGSIVRANGEALGTVTAVGKVASVEVLPGQKLDVDEVKAIDFVAKDSGGSVLAISRGSAFFQIVGGDSLSLTPDGVATGQHIGDTTVKVTVDGVTSPNALVHVDNPNIIRVPLQVNDLAYDPTRNKIYVSVAGSDPVHANSVVIVDPDTGAVSNMITFASGPRRLSVSDDGQFLFVGLDAEQSVRRVNIDTQTSVATIPVGIPGLQIEDVAALPGEPTSVAVATITFGSDAVRVYDGTTLRGATNGKGVFLSFGATGARLYGYNRLVGGNVLSRNLINGSGITVESSVNGLVTGNGNRIYYDNGVLYAADGKYYDPEVGTLLGEFTGSFLVDRVGIPDASNDRFYFITWQHNVPKNIRVYEISTGNEIDQIDTGVVPGGGEDVQICGANRIAFRTFGTPQQELVIVKNLP